MRITIFVSDSSDVDIQDMQDKIAQHFPDMEIGRDIVIEKGPELRNEMPHDNEEHIREAFLLAGQGYLLNQMRHLVSLHGHNIIVVEPKGKAVEVHDHKEELQHFSKMLEEMTPMLYRSIVEVKENRNSSPENIRSLPRSKKQKRAMAYCRNWKTGRK